MAPPAQHRSQTPGNFAGHHFTRHYNPGHRWDPSIPEPKKGHRVHHRIPVPGAKNIQPDLKAFAVTKTGGKSHFTEIGAAWKNTKGGYHIRLGALFRRMHRGDSVGQARLSAQSVAIIVKKYAHKIGLDSSRHSGHSLRCGFLTSAARKRESFFRMADQSSHKSLDVLRQYVKEEEMFDDNTGADLLNDS